MLIKMKNRIYAAPAVKGLKLCTNPYVHFHTVWVYFNIRPTALLCHSSAMQSINETNLHESNAT